MLRSTTFVLSTVLFSTTAVAQDAQLHPAQAHATNTGALDHAPSERRSSVRGAAAPSITSQPSPAAATTSASGADIGTSYCDAWVGDEDSIYWTSYTQNVIKAAAPDGTGVRDILTTPGASPFSIAVDIMGQKLYWTENNFGGGNSRKIRRADLSGSNIEDLIVDGMLDFPAGLALDLRGRKMYWGDRNASIVGRANLDGSAAEILVPNCRALGITLDPHQRKMYWAEENDKIRRANLDGTNVETLVTGQASPNDIALDRFRRKMYWTVEGPAIVRANLDGTDVETLFTASGHPFGISIDAVGQKIYWSNYYLDQVSRSNLDGSNHEVIVTLDGSEGFGLTFNPSVPVPGHIRALGDTSVASNNLTLVASGVPARTAGMFLYGSDEVFLPLGQGFRCVGGRGQRLRPPILTDLNGLASRNIDLTAEPALTDIFAAAPVTVNFQFWYRQNGSNRLTDATRVDFIP